MLEPLRPSPPPPHNLQGPTTLRNSKVLHLHGFYPLSLGFRMDNRGESRSGESSKSPMGHSERDGTDFFSVFQQLVAEYQNLPTPARINFLQHTSDIENEWCFFLMESPPGMTGSPRLILVFSALDNFDQPPICMPLRASHQAQASSGECPLDLVAAGIFQFFISGTARVFYGTEDLFAPSSLSCSDETLAGLLTVLFLKAGLTTDRRISISSPRVSLKCLVGSSTETVISAWGQNYQVDELKQLLICTSCLRLFIPNPQGYRCENCGYRSYCSEQCKEFQWGFTKTHLPTHQSECKTIHDLLDELGQKRLKENYIYLGEDEYKIKFPPQAPGIFAIPSIEDINAYLFPFLGGETKLGDDVAKEEVIEGDRKSHGVANCEKRWLKALEDPEASEEDFLDLWESPDLNAFGMHHFPVELFFLGS